jgi:membrane associated rhomboid family serine protease
MNGLMTRALTLSVPVILIASVVLVTVLGWLSQPLKRAFILSPARVRAKGEVHRLLTAGWLHSDGMHLAFNMITFYFFADEVVRVLGPTRFAALYVSAVVVGFIPTTLRHMKNERYLSLGASGAVAAVIFSAILLYPKLKMQLMFLPIPVPGPLFALAYLAYSVWHSRSGGDNVNHDAHFSGAIYGAALTYVFEPARVERTVRQFF